MYIIYRDLIGPGRQSTLPRDVEVQFEEARYQEREAARQKRLARSRRRSALYGRIKTAIVSSFGL